MTKRIISFLLILTMLLAISPSTAEAATLNELNETQMFEKQIGSGKCTLATAAMLLKRTARALDKDGWKNINSNSIRSNVWVENVGLKQKFTYNGIEVAHAELKPALPNATEVAALLVTHPEGIVLYNGRSSTQAAASNLHAVLITDYTDGVFYCADPSNGRPAGRIPLTNAWGITIDNATRYWYVSSPKVTLTVPGGDSTTPDDDVTTPDDGITSPAPTPDVDANNKTPFTDVKSTDWFYPYVEYTYTNGLINGTSDTTFAPESPLSRAMFATILYRMNVNETGETVEYKELFTDVKDGEWYSEAITWAQEAGVVTGYGNGMFGTNDMITRQQMAAMMYRYAEYAGLDVSELADLANFTDAAQVSEYAIVPVQWAVNAGLINGVTSTTLVPNGNATRAQCATIITRFDQTF